MTRAVLLLLFTFPITYSIFAQTNEELNNAFKCQQKWEYQNLDKITKGTILFHKKAPIYCGILSVASVSIIRTEKGDTIRVLQLCNTEKDFSAGANVSVKPGAKPPFRVNFVPYDFKACVILKACFGSVEKAEDA